MSKTLHDNRRAYSLAELAEMCGRHRSWSYRLARSGRIKTIIGYGRELVPSSEIDRILDEVSTTEVHAQ